MRPNSIDYGNGNYYFPYANIPNAVNQPYVELHNYATNQPRPYGGQPAQSSVSSTTNQFVPEPNYVNGPSQNPNPVSQSAAPPMTQPTKSVPVNSQIPFAQPVGNQMPATAPYSNGATYSYIPSNNYVDVTYNGLDSSRSNRVYLMRQPKLSAAPTRIVCPFCHEYVSTRTTGGSLCWGIVPFFCFFFVAIIVLPLIMTNTQSEILFSLFPVIFFGLFFFMAGFIIWKSFKTKHYCPKCQNFIGKPGDVIPM